MLRYFIIFGVIVAGGVIALSFYQPPMRLMPAPAVFLDGQKNAFAANPTLIEDSRIPLFYATNRLPVGPRDNRLYAVVPGRDLHMGVATIEIGEEARPGTRSTNGRRAPAAIGGLPPSRKPERTGDGRGAASR